MVMHAILIHRSVKLLPYKLKQFKCYLKVGGVIVLVFACTYLFTAVNIASSEATNATAFYCFIKDHLPNDSRIINRIPKVRPRYCKNWIYEIVSAVLGMSFGLTQAITAACLIGVCVSNPITIT